MTAVWTWAIAAVCVLGDVFNIKKLVGGFYCWAFGNILWLAYDFWCGLYSRCILDIIQLGFAVWGIIEWSKKEVRHA